MTEMNTRTLPRQARSAKSLDLILDAAEQLMYDHGVAETSTVDVAAAAGVSVGRLYYWFPDKDAVVAAVLGRAEQRARAFLVEMVVDNPTLSAVELIETTIPALAEFFRSHPGSLAVLQRGPTDGDDPGRPLFRLFVELAASVLGSRGPQIPTSERDRVANACVRITITLMNEVLRCDPIEADLYLRELQSVLVSYISRRYPESVGLLHPASQSCE